MILVENFLSNELVLLDIVNQPTFFLRLKRTYAGSSEKPIGHRVRCFLFQQADYTKFDKPNNEKKLHECAKLAQKMCCFFSIKQLAQLTFYKLYSTKNMRKKS